MFYIYYIILKLESLHIKTTVCTSVLLAIMKGNYTLKASLPINGLNYIRTSISLK
jgi:hypothetical protein